MKQQRRITLAVATVLASTGAISACSSLGGGGDPYGENTSAPPAAPAAPSDPIAPTASSYAGGNAGSTAGGNAGATAGGNAGATAAAAPRFALAATQNKALGWVVTDGKGWILYRFDKDKASPAPTPSCTGACAQKWPPVVWRGQPALDGVSSGLVGKIRRPDGTWQLTLHGWPVYRFAGDTRPGQWKGQGVGGTWHAIMRNGGRNLTKAAAAKPSTDSTAPAITDPYGNSSNY